MQARFLACLTARLVAECGIEVISVLVRYSESGCNPAAQIPVMRIGRVCWLRVSSTLLTVSENGF
jgi:hypothetical protein